MYLVWKHMQNTLQNRALFTASLAHIIHDGFTDMIYIFFPIWQAQFSLSFMEIGFLKTLFSGTMAFFQVPSSWLAGKTGGIPLLLWGTLLTSLAVCFYGWAGSGLLLGCFLVLGGLGSSVQHPLSSTLLAHACPDTANRRIALSSFNMAGDFGKLLLPAAAALLIRFLGWEDSAHWMGVLGFFATGILFFSSRGLEWETQAAANEQKKCPSSVWKSENRHFWALVLIGIVDSGTRMGFLTFFPFLLQEHGADVTITALALSLVFAGGALGKLACGLMSTRWGSVKTVLFTEIATSFCILGMLWLPLQLELGLSFFLGIALNGTSSVLYGTVPDLVSATDCQQAFAVFYTATIAAGALSPCFYGAISDTVGMQQAVLLVAGLVWLTVPLVIFSQKRKMVL